MRTLVLAQQPFRGLRSRAILSELAGRCGRDEALLVATKAPRCPPPFAAVPAEADPASLGIGRVVLAGIFQDRAELERAFTTAARAVAAGAQLQALGLSLEGAAARREPPRGAELLDQAAAIEVREAHTANALLVWRIAAPFRMRPYPEGTPAADAALARRLPAGPILGLSILGGTTAARAWPGHLDLLRQRLAPYRDWPLLVLPAEARTSPLDDLAASLAFAAKVLPDAKPAVPEAELRDWRERLTPQRLAGLVARCSLVVASQDLPAVQAIAAGVPVLGLAMGLGGERRIVSAFATLANRLPTGSDLLFLHPPGSTRDNASARA